MMRVMSKGDVGDVVSAIKAVFDATGKVPQSFVDQCKEGLTIAEPFVVAAFYRELTAACPDALKCF